MLLITLLATVVPAFPACDAVMEHVPTLTTWIAPLATVQIEEVVEAKATGYEPPAELVATKVCGSLVMVIAVGWVKVIVLASLVIAMLLTTLIAGR